MPSVRTFDPNPHNMLEVHRALRQIRVQLPPSTLDQTDAPTINDDITQGWRIGSKWIHSEVINATTEYYTHECLDNSEGAAVWTQLVGLLIRAGGSVGGIAGTPVRLGNILAEDTTGVIGRLAAGTNDNVLIADSAQTLGVKWGTVTSILAGSIYFEAYLRATTGTVYADLYDETGSASVSGSQVSTTSSSFVLVRSSALTLTLNNTYRPRFGIVGTDAGQHLGAVALAI